MNASDVKSQENNGEITRVVYILGAGFSKPLGLPVMANGREIVKRAYTAVGRPGLYHDDIVHYVTDEQFGYVASVDGIMVRERPAACGYTLIGEELFAASAYLSGDQRAIASLRGQDVGKLLSMGAIAVGSILATFVSIGGGGFFLRLSDAFQRLFALNY